MDKKIVMLAADGFEEAECVIVIDVLRRLGFAVDLVAADNTATITGTHRIVLQADGALRDCRPEEIAAVVLPGGMPGAAGLRDNPAVIALLRRVHASGGVAAAICAAPIALQKAGLLEHCRFTAYPGFESEFGARTPSGRTVERGDRVVTGRGPGAAFAFAVEVAAALGRGEAADQLMDQMLVAR